MAWNPDAAYRRLERAALRYGGYWADKLRNIREFERARLAEAGRDVSRFNVDVPGTQGGGGTYTVTSGMTAADVEARSGAGGIPEQGLIPGMVLRERGGASRAQEAGAAGGVVNTNTKSVSQGPQGSLGGRPRELDQGIDRTRTLWTDLRTVDRAFKDIRSMSPLNYITQAAGQLGQNMWDQYVQPGYEAGYKPFGNVGTVASAAADYVGQKAGIPDWRQYLGLGAAPTRQDEQLARGTMAPIPDTVARTEQAVRGLGAYAEQMPVMTSGVEKIREMNFRAQQYGFPDADTWSRAMGIDIVESGLTAAEKSALASVGLYTYPGSNYGSYSNPSLSQYDANKIMRQASNLPSGFRPRSRTRPTPPTRSYFSGNAGYTGLVNWRI